MDQIIYCCNECKDDSGAPVVLDMQDAQMQCPICEKKFANMPDDPVTSPT